MVARLTFIVAFSACVSQPAPNSGPLSGGAIRVSDMPAHNVEVTGDTLLVWGMTEVPAGSRLQAAEAMVDAITRAELLKLVQVSVASMQLDVESNEKKQIELVTAEIVRAKLSTAAPIQHGWEQQGDTLRLVGRLELSRALFLETLAAKLPPPQAEAIASTLWGQVPK